MNILDKSLDLALNYFINKIMISPNKIDKYRITNYDNIKDKDVLFLFHQSSNKLMYVFKNNHRTNSSFTVYGWDIMAKKFVDCNNNYFVPNYFMTDFKFVDARNLINSIEMLEEEYNLLMSGETK